MASLPFLSSLQMGSTPANQNVLPKPSATPSSLDKYKTSSLNLLGNTLITPQNFKPTLGTTNAMGATPTFPSASPKLTLSKLSSAQSNPITATPNPSMVNAIGNINANQGMGISAMSGLPQTGMANLPPNPAGPQLNPANGLNNGGVNLNPTVGSTGSTGSSSGTGGISGTGGAGGGAVLGAQTQNTDAQRLAIQQQIKMLQDQIKAQTGNGTPGTPTTPTTTPTSPGNDYGGLIQQLIALQNEYSPLMAASAQKLADIQQGTQTSLQNTYTNPDELETMTGRAGMIQQIGAERAQVEQQKLTNLQGQLSQRAGILGTAMGASAPVSGAAFFRDPVTGELKVGSGAGGGIGAAGAITGQLSMAQALPQQKANLANAAGLKDSINNLVTTSGINPSQFTDINNITQFLYGKVADPRYQTLSNAVSQYVQTIAPIVGVDVNTIAANILGSGGKIMDVLNNLQAMANNKIITNENAVNGTNNPLNTTPTFTSGTNTITGGTGGTIKTNYGDINPNL